jgi:hypothetical protein
LVAELTDRLLGGIVLYLLTVGMGEFVNPGERSGREKCQRRDHRLMLPKFLILPPTDPLVRRFATFVKQGTHIAALPDQYPALLASSFAFCSRVNVTTSPRATFASCFDDRA